MNNTDQKVAIVTGANRGLGFEVARELAQKKLKVILTARDLKKAADAAATLAKEGLEVTPMALDVTQTSSITALAQAVRKQFGRLDVLVNNAGVFLDAGWHGGGSSNAMDAKVDMIRETLETNVYGPFQLCQALIPLMKENGYGRIVNVSSGMGQLGDMSGGYPGYRISKTALNTVTRVFASETEGTGILVNSVCPGWVKTDMGGAEAERTPKEGADTIVWLATLPNGSPSGGFYRDRKPIEW